MRTYMVIQGSLLAALLALSAAPASASTISLLSSDGHFRAIFDDAQPSVLGKTAHGLGGGTVGFEVNGNFATPLAAPHDQIDFNLDLHVQFIPEPGFAFTSMSLADAAPVGYSFGLFGAGYRDVFSASVTDLGNSNTQAFSPLTVQAFPPDGQGGGGAFNQGIIFGTIVPPAQGLDLSMQQLVTIFGASSLNIGRIDVDLGTVGVAIPPPPPVPEPGSLFLLGTGLLGLGCTVRRKMA